jgi:hypothetical protein
MNCETTSGGVNDSSDDERTDDYIGAYFFEFLNCDNTCPDQHNDKYRDFKSDTEMQ